MLKLVLASASVVWYGFLWSLGMIGCVTARKRYRLRPRSPLASAPPSSVPGVTILRPLKGLDTNLYENLESTFLQEYPSFEIFFCVDNEEDQALSVVRDLLAKYPHVNAKIAVGRGLSVGVNPKVNNLMTGYRQAAHDILWVLDSNIMVDRGTLARSVDILDPPPNASNPPRRRIGVVHHVPLAWVTKDSLGSRIEEAFLNTNHAKMYIAINTVAIESCVVGKSCLYRKSDLERIDGSLKPIYDAANGGHQPGERGLAAFGKYLAEDNMIASALWHELDLRHDLSCDVARNAIGDMSIMDYVARRIRWVRVRKHMVLAATLTEPFTESLLVGSLASLGLQYLTGLPPWLFLLFHFLLWLLVDMDVFASLAGEPIPSEKRWRIICAWVLREVMALPIFLVAVVGNKVIWRGQEYDVVHNGEVRRVSGATGRTWIPRWIPWSGRETLYYEPLESQ